MKTSNIEAVKNRLKTWDNINSIEEINDKWLKAKYWIINNAETFEERKELDLLIQDYYWKNLSRIEKENL